MSREPERSSRAEEREPESASCSELSKRPQGATATAARSVPLTTGAEADGRTDSGAGNRGYVAQGMSEYWERAEPRCCEACRAPQDIARKNRCPKSVIRRIPGSKPTERGKGWGS